MSEYTNIDPKPIGVLNGIPIRPCMKSGFCCTLAPCAFGEWNENKSACKYLSEPNGIGQRDCGRYEWIVANVPNYELYPAFGAGCSSAMFNHMRDKVIENIKNLK
jgi:hypothetical protein